MKNILLVSATVLMSLSSQAMTVQCVISSKSNGSSIQKMVSENPNFMADLTSVDDAYYTVVTQAQLDGGLMLRVIRESESGNIYEESLKKSVVLNDDAYETTVTCTVK